MGKEVMYSSVSVDGFIADENDQLSLVRAADADPPQHLTAAGSTTQPFREESHAASTHSAHARDQSAGPAQRPCAVLRLTATSSHPPVRCGTRARKLFRRRAQESTASGH